MVEIQELRGVDPGHSPVPLQVLSEVVRTRWVVPGETGVYGREGVRVVDGRRRPVGGLRTVRTYTVA